MSVITEPQLLQLQYLDDPYRFGVACILLNRTTRQQVDRAIRDLFLEYPTADALARARVDEVRELIRPLGLNRIRTERLVRFAEDLASGTPYDACFGVGQYARDAWNLLHGDLDVEPADKELRRWKRWREA